MKLLPSLKNKPPTAGRMANASGTECQCELSSLLFPRLCPAALLGNSKLSVESAIEWEKSDTTLLLRLGNVGCLLTPELELELDRSKPDDDTTAAP